MGVVTDNVMFAYSSGGRKSPIQFGDTHWRGRLHTAYVYGSRLIYRQNPFKMTRVQGWTPHRFSVKICNFPQMI